MKIEKALDRIKKLLTLAEGNTTPEEAAQAMTTAQFIMDKYRIDEAAVQASRMDDESDVPTVAEVDSEMLEHSVPGKVQRIPTWRLRLVQAIAEANNCGVFTSHRKLKRGQPFVASVHIYGTETDRAVVRYMMLYLGGINANPKAIGEVARITKRQCKGMGRTYANSFRLGCVATITNRMAEAQTEGIRQLKGEILTEQGGTAIMRIESILERQAEVQTEWEEKQGFVSSRAKKYNLSGSGFAAGKEAGEGVNLATKGGALKS
jgi:hypothetical protein